MKKLMNKSFWIILLTSLITLICLVIGVIFLTKDSQKEFYSAGYIISTNTSKSNKYYFNDNTVYKENVFDEYVFKNKENDEISVSKDNFIHYSDKSLSFMQNGVILDLDNFNNSMVPYYNITDKSIVKYNNGNYYIENSDKTLTLNNFIGKITDNKYIVVGNDVNIKLAGNDKIIKDKYFEFMFVEDGIVKIVNEDSDYQTVAEGTIIYVGDNIKINLGDKTITNGDEVKLTLNEMTINGDENIDIVPNENSGKVKKNEEKSGTNTSENGEDGAEGNGTGGNGSDGNGTGAGGNETGDNNTDDKTNGNGNNEDNPNGEENIKTVVKKEIIVDLISAKVDFNNILTEFQIIDTGNYTSGNLILTLQNITKEEENKTKELVVNANEIQKANFSDLSPNCNYLMTITDVKDISGTQYFRRVFKTESIGDINLKLEMADTNSLEYIVEFDNTNIKKGTLVLSTDGNTIEKEVINQGTYSNVVFEGLESDTKYNVMLKNIVYTNNGTSDISYDSNINFGSNMTLKRTPKLEAITAVPDEEKKLTKLVVDAPEDIDNSITKYTYKIYKRITLVEEGEEEAKTKYELAYEFEKMRSQLETKTIKIDDAEYKVIDTNEEKLIVNNKNIFANTEYAYEVVAEYYDNYKYGEIKTGLSNTFTIPEDDTTKVTFVEDENGISYEQIKGTIKITDSKCSIPVTGRECNDLSNSFSIKYLSSKTGETKFLDNVKFEEKQKGSNVLEYHLNLNQLTQNTTYSFEVYANAYSYGELVSGKYIGSFIVTTKGMESLKMQNWNQNDYSYDIPISVSTEITSTVADSQLINKLAKIDYKLYRGKCSEEDLKKNACTEIGSYTATGSDIVKNQKYNITSKNFGIENLDSLKELSGGTLNDYYTIVVADAYDEGDVNKINIENRLFVYTTPPLLILENIVSNIEIIVDKITNEQTKSGEYDISHDDNLNDNTVVGYKVTASIKDIGKIIQKNYNPMKINFYVYNQKNKLIENRTMEVGYDDNGEIINSYVTYFYLGEGTKAEVEDTDLRRGNEYIFAFDISIDTNSDYEADTNFPSGKVKNSKEIAEKQKPYFRIYIDSSTSDSLTYKYVIEDYDNAFYEEEGERYFYYTINDGEEEYKSKLEEDTFVLENLSNASIYNLSYYVINDKNRDPSNVKYNSYYFDGYYKIENFNYNLQYSNFDNRLKIVLENNDFMNRVSEYLVTLTTKSGEKYQKVFSQNDFAKKTVLDENGKKQTVDECDENKCFVIDYSDIKELKNKDVTASVEAFYDTGYTGISMKGNLGDYFVNLGLADKNNKDHIGYVYQNNGKKEPGTYYYLSPDSKIKSANFPMGIHTIEFLDSNIKNQIELKTKNLVDTNNKEFFKSDDRTLTLSNNRSVDGLSNSNIVYNLKVLDKTSLITDNDKFKFTSITPKVSTNVTPTINGGSIKVNLSIDSDTLESDFVKTEGKHKFYIDVYKKKECPEETEEECVPEDILVKTVETSYEEITNTEGENAGNIIIDELDPNSNYYYKISADMNKNDEKVKTPLFKNENGYIEHKDEFSTLDAESIFEGVKYHYDSTSSNKNEETKKYSIRTLNVEANLKTNINFDIKFEIYDKEGTLEYEKIIENKEITSVSENEFIATYLEDISGEDFVFGPDYHTLKITAITTDSKQNNLELYNDVLIDETNLIDKPKKLFKELELPKYVIKPTKVTENSIDVDIVISDEDKVIKDGKVYVELQKFTINEGYVNACLPGHEAECRFTIDYFKNGFNVNKTFSNLNSDSSYFILVSADTYRNNYHNGTLFTDEEKNSNVSVRKNQYTNNSLEFSLGLVTPTATSKNKLVITFTGSSNLTESITGIDYNINVQGGGVVKSGTLGKTDTIDGPNIEFKKNSEEEDPRIEIDLDEGQELGKNNYIMLVYYYKDGNSIKALGSAISYGVNYNED